MQQWFRQPICIRYYVASLGFAMASQTLIAQQSPSSGPSPSFRLTAPVGKAGKEETPTPAAALPPSGLILSEPPVMQWQPSTESKKLAAVDETTTETEDDDPRGFLLIGSASTRLVSGSDDEPSVFESASTEEAEFNESTLFVILELAQAGLSHASPLFRALNYPVLQGFSEDASTASRTLARLASSKRVLDPKDETESHNNAQLTVDEQEPPRLSMVEDVKFAETEPENDPNDATVDATPLRNEADERESSNPIAKSEPEAPISTRRPTPRTVKMPFDDSPLNIEPSAKPSTPIANIKNESKPVRFPDIDSQKDQEEPSIESAPRGNDKDLQGVDALKASKPGLHRREIRIDDNGLGKAVPPVVPKKSLPPELDQRLKRAQACVDHYLKNPESTSVRSPWAVMHAVLAYGGDYELIHGAGRVNAIGWMCHNGTCRTQRMFTPRGKGFVPNVGGGVQGHEGQFLAILAQCNVPLDYPIQIGAAKFKVEDLVRYEMATCKEKSELTFKLIGLSYYLDSNKQWRANDGQVWSIPKLIQEELAQPIIGSACGGTHRLMGFSFSVRQRQLQNEPVNGQYARAAKFVREYVPYTLQLQNPDGSFSTNWYEGRANEPNDERKVQTSGHMMEWLMYTMTDEEIQQPRIAKGIDFLLSKIYDQRDRKWPIGPRGHATRAIALYQARINELMDAPATLPPMSTASNKAPAPTKAQSASKQMAAPIVRK